MTTRYRVYCTECNWKETAGSMTEVRYMEKEHYRNNKCLEAEHERIA